MGAMGAAAMSRARGSDDDEADDAPRPREVEASYRSAQTFGFDELIDPARSATCCCTRSNARCYRRQAPAEPVARIGITP